MTFTIAEELSYREEIFRQLDRVKIDYLDFLER